MTPSQASAPDPVAGELAATSTTRESPLRSSVVACLLAFLASFCVMVVELVAGRLIAKHVGFSLYTWTSVIGVVLAGIMCGNLAGGRLADRYEPRRVVAMLFLMSALACAAVPLLDYRVGDLQLLESLESWPLRIAIHVTIVFFLPAITLGLIGPVVAKMALDGAAHTGRTVGNVYGWGAFGSIVGTFATGFVLIGRFGTLGIIFGVALLLSLIGLTLLSKRWSPAAALPIALVVGAIYYYGPWQWSWQSGRLAVRTACLLCIWADESNYQFIKVTANGAASAHVLTLDNLIHAYYVPGDPREGLRYEYEQSYAVATARAVADRPTLKTFFIGGGGYEFPRYVRARWPGSVVMVAEIDPVVTRAGMEAFGLDAGTLRFGGPADLRRGGLGTPTAQRASIDIFHLDARNAVADLVSARRHGHLDPFDAIYGDAFNSDAVPFHLVTREFAARVRELLDPATGVYLINVVDSFASGRFVGAVQNTLRSVFPYVYIIGTEMPSEDSAKRDTFVLAAAQHALDLANLGKLDGEADFEGVLLDAAALAKLETRSRGLILTDDFSPVENLLDPVVRHNRAKSTVQN